MIPRIVAATHYRIPLDPEVFDLIMFNDTKEEYEHHTLNNRIEVITGIWGVSYNAHYGECILLTIDDEYDTGYTWDTLEDLIAEYIGGGYVE